MDLRGPILQIDMRHIFPTNDIGTHHPSVFCRCSPNVNESRGVTLHTSFDGREIIIAAEIAIEARCECCLYYINEKGERTDPPPKFIEQQLKG